MTEATQTGIPAALAPLFPERARRRLVALRRDLHSRPELSFAEHATADRLESELRGLEPLDLRRVAGTGLVARIRGRSPGAPVVAIRGDIDALPIQEETGLDYASRADGVMHACGHDVHATWAVGAAMLLTEEPAAGDVLIVLQPGEETGQGAARMLDAGALDGVAAIFGGHVDLRFPTGEVVADAGPLAAATDMFAIELVGRGGHGARPHEVRDPIVGAAALVTALQTIVARRLNPASPGVVSVGSIHAGNAPNVIPERVALAGTLRATTVETRELLHRELRRITDSVADAYGLTAELSLELGPPAIVNPDEPIRWAREAVASLLGESALVPLGFLNLAGEDFACYMERIPGCFLRIGARAPGGEAVAAHTSRFHPDERSVFVGAAVLAETARRASSALASPASGS